MQDEIEKLDPGEICTLPADGLGERLAFVRAEILTHAVANERTADAIAWELRDAPGLAAKLDELVEKERECCSGIVFAHAPSAVAGRRRLTVQGVDPDAAVFRGLDVGQAQPPRSGARLAKSAGLGTAFALFVCCVLPIGAAAALGAAAAAPLASLDRPWVIGLVAILSGGAAFAWQGRRLRTGQGPVSPAGAGTGCGPDC